MSKLKKGVQALKLEIIDLYKSCMLILFLANGFSKGLGNPSVDTSHDVRTYWVLLSSTPLYRFLCRMYHTPALMIGVIISKCDHDARQHYRRDRIRRLCR